MTRRRRRPVLLVAALTVLAGVVAAFALGAPGMAAGGGVLGLSGGAVLLSELVCERGFSLRMARLPMGGGWRQPDGQ